MTPTSAMRQSSGASYHNWLLACDRWLASKTQGTISGTFALVVSNYDWQGSYQSDALPSEAVENALESL